MAILSQITVTLACLSVVITLCQAAVVAPAAAAANAAGSVKPAEETWKPVTEPKEFKVNVADGIQGANQIRYEKWDKGTMTGMFSKPLGDGKHEVVTYIADDKGYRITSTKVVDESELSKIQAGAETTPNKASVEVQHDGINTHYTVTPDQIAAPEKAQSEQKSEQKPEQKQS